MSPKALMVGAALVLGGLLCLVPRLAQGCLADSPAAYSAETYVTAERAVIIWDQKHQIEHFIRQASIKTASPDLGFVVPTPETPELSEVDPRIFDMANDIGKPISTPPVIYHTASDYFAPIFAGLTFFDPPSVAMSIAPASAAQNTILSTSKPMIVAEQDVAGYHATTLAAENVGAVTAWLDQHGYALTPEIEAWLKTYAATKWKLTAFELHKTDAPSKSSNTLATRAIRLSFPTSQPFYPYSEPSDKQKAAAASPLGRALRVAVLSDQRMIALSPTKLVGRANLNTPVPPPPLPSRLSFPHLRWQHYLVPPWRAHSPLSHGLPATG